MVTCQLGDTVRNKLLNYKEATNSSFAGEEVAFSLNCECEHSQICDPFRKHIITGDLRIINNSKLTTLMKKGLNHRQSLT